MWQRLRTFLRHPVSRSLIALYWIQVATFVVPMVTLPYVSRVLQPSGFGLVVFAQGFAFVLVLFVDWGFGYTGIRASAEHQDDRDALSDVVHRTRGGQLVLSTLSIPVALLALLLIPKLREHPELLALAWVAAVATGLSPAWFFLGTEKARVMAAIVLVFRVLGAALTFPLVSGPDDAWIVMALFAGSSIGSLAVADFVMYRTVAFRLPNLRTSLHAVRGATMIFVSTVAVTLYTTFNVVLLGLFQPSTDVAHFGAAERMVRVGLTVLGPIGTAVIPRLTALQAAGERQRARRLLTRAVLASAIPALLLTAALELFAPSIIGLVYGQRFVDASVPIMRVLALIIPINVTGVVFGLWLMTLHHDRLVAQIVVCAGVANIVLGCVLTPLFGPLGMAWSVIAAEMIGAGGGIIMVRRNSRGAARALEAVPLPES